MENADHIEIPEVVQFTTSRGMRLELRLADRNHLYFYGFPKNHHFNREENLKIIDSSSTHFIREAILKLAESTGEIPMHYLGTSNADNQDSEEKLLKFKAKNPSKHADFLHHLRKDQHIEICRTKDIEASDKKTGFEKLHFIPKSIPELSWTDLDTSAEFLGRVFSAPILITGMTGGVSQATEINKHLAEAASRVGIPMGVGSQRLALENPKFADVFRVKCHAPDLFVIGNLGIGQLLGSGPKEWNAAVSMIEADAMAIHVNVIQELVQVEGDRNFRGVLNQISRLRDTIDIPIVVKEVGSGMDLSTAKKLLEIGIDAIDVGGKGGTSWGYIEGNRTGHLQTKRLGNLMRDWGIPTANSLAALRSSFQSLPLIATGGIRDGVTVAKAVAIGANMAGIGLPLFKAALKSSDTVVDILSNYIRELKATMLATGSCHLKDLSSCISLNVPYEDWLEKRLSELQQKLHGDVEIERNG